MLLGCKSIAFGFSSCRYQITKPMVFDLKTYGFITKSIILFINRHIIILPQPHMKVYEG